jgi:putative ABC transport system permease protein
LETRTGRVVSPGAIYTARPPRTARARASYAATQQTREFGVRLALGANPRGVLVMVLLRGLVLVGTGTAIGPAAAVGAGRGLAALLPGVNASDALPYLAVTGLLLFVGAAACLVPARRAMRLDPVEILRAD